MWWRTPDASALIAAFGSPSRCCCNAGRIHHLPDLQRGEDGRLEARHAPIAYILEVIIVGVLVLIPLIYTQALPKAQLMTFLAAPPPPPPPPPPPAAAAPVSRVIHQVSVED